MKRLSLLMLASFWAAIASTAISHAQSPSEEGIHGTGEFVLERKPELIRVYVHVLAKGKDLPDAIAKIKLRQAEAEKQMESLGATKESVNFGDVELDQSQDDQEKQIEMLMRQRMAPKRGTKRPEDKGASAKPVKVKLTLTAEWSLPAGDASESLLATEKIQEAIKSADFGGLKEEQELTPEEAELAEEMEGMVPDFDGSGDAKQGGPLFVFVARINAADREQALAEAFRAAKQKATELAKAAELDLGPLRSLQSDSGLESQDHQEFREYYGSPFLMALHEQLTGHMQSGEAIGLSPGPLKLRFTVNATFAAK